MYTPHICTFSTTDRKELQNLRLYKILLHKFLELMFLVIILHGQSFPLLEQALSAVLRVQQDLH